MKRFLFAIVATFLLGSNLSIAGVACGVFNGAYVYSAEDTPVYLGFFGRTSHAESIMNFSGQYGSSSGIHSVRNATGKYGSSNGEFSANNSNGWSLAPPGVYKNGAFIGYLTTSWLEEPDRTSLAEIDSSCSFNSNTPPAVEPADLAITILDPMNGTFAPGDGLDVIAKIENIGSKVSGSYQLRFYASTDRTITPEDYNDWVWNMDALGEGENHHHNFKWSLPESIPPGKYYIGAIVTVADDSNVSNNTRYHTSPITVLGDSSTSFRINSGLNDAWYDPETNGQGFFITALPQKGVVVLAWFTYDTSLPADGETADLGDSGHRWLTAEGSFTDNQAVLNITSTSGGVFDTPSDVQRTDDGTIILTFDDCNSGTIEYDIPSIGRDGTIPIQRVADDNIALCEALLTP